MEFQTVQRQIREGLQDKGVTPEVNEGSYELMNGLTRLFEKKKIILATPEKALLAT